MYFRFFNCLVIVFVNFMAFIIHFALHFVHFVLDFVTLAADMVLKNTLSLYNNFKLTL